MGTGKNMHPVKQYKNIVEAKASEYLSTMMGSDAGQEASGRVALAYRQAAAQNDRIYTCTPESVAQAIALSAMTGLMPGGPLPDVYLLPRGNSLQWQVSYRGYARLAEEAGVKIRARAVFNTDDFHVVEGLNPDLQHTPDLTADQSWESLRAVYVIATDRSGASEFVVIRKADIEKRRGNSDAFRRSKGSSPWEKWPVEMALKTGIRYAIARGLVSLNSKGSVAYEQDGEQDKIHDVIDVTDEPAQEAKSQNNGMNALSEAVAQLPQDVDFENPEPAAEPVAETNHPDDDVDVIDLQ